MPNTLSQFMLECAESHRWQDFTNHLVDSRRFQGALVEWQATDQSTAPITWGAGCLTPDVRRARVGTPGGAAQGTWTATAAVQDLRLTLHLDMPPAPLAAAGNDSQPFAKIKRVLKNSLHPAADIAAASRNRIVAAAQAGALQVGAFPAFIVDANATAIAMNAHARAELANGPGDIKLSAASVLELPTLDGTRALLEAVRAQSGGPAQSPSFLILRDGNHKISGIVAVARRSIPEVSIAPPFVIVTFAALSRLRPLRDDEMKEAFDLTPAEAALANAIGSGASVKSYASTLGVTESTVRWHLHNVLQSIDAENQIELARVVFALQAMNG